MKDSWLTIGIALFALHGSPVLSDEEATMTAEEALLATEDAYVAAEVSRDEDALRRLLDDRFQFNTAKGRTTGKEHLISSVMQMNMVAQTLRERSVLVEGDMGFTFGTAVLTFEEPDGKQSQSTLRYTSAYVNRDGEWRMIMLQMQARSQD